MTHLPIASGSNRSVPDPATENRINRTINRIVKLTLPSTALMLAAVISGCVQHTRSPAPPAGSAPVLVDLQSVEPTIQRAIRYAGAQNFVGAPITGYETPTCLLTAEAAGGLKKAQLLLQPYGLGLLVYDCYRPQRAVDHFMRWAQNLDDQATKALYYPNIEKESLVRDGYIAERSGHTRGSTVDLTLIDAAGTPLDMGTRWDYFDTTSHTAYADLQPLQRRNRLLLISVMARAGFDNYPKEWWHFTLRDEPHPDRYLNQPVQSLSARMRPPA